MRTTSVILLTAMLVFACVARANADEQSWATFSQKAEALSKQGKHLDSISLYKAALEEAEKFGNSDPRLARTLEKLATEYESVKNMQEANKCLKRALNFGRPIQQGTNPTYIREKNELIPTARVQKTPIGLPSMAPAPSVSPSPAAVPSPAAPCLDFGPYMADTQRRIKKHWFPPKGMEKERATVLFEIHSDGKASNVRISKSSNIVAVDQAALNAVSDSSPFRPLPLGSPDKVDIQFTFDYNVFNGQGGGTVTRAF